MKIARVSGTPCRLMSEQMLRWIDPMYLRHRSETFVKILVLTAVLLTASFSANAICMFPAEHSAENTVSQADTVFIATITKAYLDPDYENVSKGEQKSRLRTWYTVRYDFVVAIPIKGKPSSVPFLMTNGLYNDPSSGKFKTAGELSKFVPGDNILVVTNGPGPVPISSVSGCTDSMPWDNEAYDLLKKVNLLRVPENKDAKAEVEKPAR